MQAVVVGFILSVKFGLNALDPVGRGKKAEYQVTDDDVQVGGIVTCYISLLHIPRANRSSKIICTFYLFFFLFSLFEC